MSCSFASLLVAPLLFPHHSKKLILPRRRARAAITSSLRLGVDDLAELAHNKVLVAAAISGAVGQLSKPLTSAIRTGKGIDLWAAVSAGGMPSTHSAVRHVSSASSFGSSVLMALNSEGILLNCVRNQGCCCSGNFAWPREGILGLNFWRVCGLCFSRHGVRREVGSHAKILNKIRSSQEEDDVQSPSARSSSVNCEKMSPFASISEKAESYGPNSESYSFRGPGFTSTKVDMPNSKVNVKVPLLTEYSNYSVLNESVGHTEVQVLVGAMLGLIVSVAVDVIL
ncbi:Divergent PAP2 family [Musa troglodytarum]|uniref:Divergent PAP2 family n=1 Tax=Musa troglodytarum TaxID=320322 RepID=A0A9E7K486_9LILI|nr:Divergent PAP2 family [Musa troglodytarum]